jgi:hypothetical protein
MCVAPDERAQSGDNHVNCRESRTGETGVRKPREWLPRVAMPCKGEKKPNFAGFFSTFGTCMSDSIKIRIDIEGNVAVEETSYNEDGKAYYHAIEYYQIGQVSEIPENQ